MNSCSLLYTFFSWTNQLDLLPNSSLNREISELEVKGHEPSRAELKKVQLEPWLEPARLGLITSKSALLPVLPMTTALQECRRRRFLTSCPTNLLILVMLLNKSFSPHTSENFFLFLERCSCTYFENLISLGSLDVGKNLQGERVNFFDWLGKKRSMETVGRDRGA